MTGRALLEQDRRDVSGEGGRIRRCGVRRGELNGQCRRRRQEEPFHSHLTNDQRVMTVIDVDAVTDGRHRRPKTNDESRC
jgi:hypothetical protein